MAAESFADGREVYSTCSACHLATGEGVPGAFPPINNRLPQIAASQAGRDYLIHLLLKGMNGAITVDGTPYQGYMQSYGDTLSDDQISQVLNYVAVRLADGGGTKGGDDFALFTPLEVASVRAKFAESTTSSLELRNKLGLD